MTRARSERGYAPYEQLQESDEEAPTGREEARERSGLSARSKKRSARRSGADNPHCCGTVITRTRAAGRKEYKVARKGGSRGSKGSSGKNYRSASTGRFVKKSTADRYPDKTVGERRK